MNNTLFEQFGGTYAQQGDYLLPNLTLPAEAEIGYIRVWGQRRLNYLKHHRKVLYYNLLTSGKLRFHLADTEEQTQQLFLGGKRTRRKRRRDRTTKSTRPNEMGSEDERHQ